MTKISNVDQVLLLLRQQLDRMATRAPARRTTKTGSATGAERKALHRVRALAALGNLSDEDLERSFIHGLLVEQFGDDIANDPQFQRTVADVHRVIASDDASRRLLGQATRRLLDQP